MKYIESIKNNKKKLCKVTECNSYRHGLSSYCSRHEQRYYAYGHPLALKIRPRDYKIELRQVEHILNNNQQHEGIQHAVEFLNNMLKSASSYDRRVPAYDFVGNLYDKGLRGEELLKHMAALYQFHRGNSGTVKSDNHFKFAVGGVVLTLRSQDGVTIKGRHRATLGQLLVDNLGALCLNICQAIEQQEAKHRERYQKFTQPLNI